MNVTTELSTPHILHRFYHSPIDTSSGVGAAMMERTDQVRRTGEWMQENYPDELVERVTAQAHGIGQLIQQLEHTQSELEQAQAHIADLEAQLHEQ